MSYENQTKNQMASYTATILTGLAAMFSQASIAAVMPGTTQQLSEVMNAEVETMKRVAPMLPIKDDCVPVRVGGIGRIDFQYLACSDEAREADLKEYKISENITVPEALAPRFNFWRRVYSLWSKNQFVMHIADFPEVVLEIHDGSRTAELGEKTREKLMKPWLDSRRKEYQQILLKLHRYSGDVSLLTATEQRVHAAFSHIQRKDKFLTAAQSIRVQRGQREFIESGLAVAPKYLPHIIPVFQKEGLPPEYAKIAFIESSFNLRAMSKVGASGIYQIMPQTGKDYLILENGIDERNDPIKAAKAAAKLLVLNHKILGEWPLAITAYNHGVGGIRRAMQATGSSDIVTLIDKYDGPNFGFASKNFYCGFLGLLATLEKSDKLFSNVPKVEALSFSTVRVGGMSLSQVKSKHKLSNATIMAFNPDISKSFVNADGVFPRRYQVKVPQKAIGNSRNVNVASERAVD